MCVKVYLGMYEHVAWEIDLRYGEKKNHMITLESIDLRFFGIYYTSILVIIIFFSVSKIKINKEKRERVVNKVTVCHPPV